MKGSRRAEKEIRDWQANQNMHDSECQEFGICSQDNGKQWKSLVRCVYVTAKELGMKICKVML